MPSIHHEFITSALKKSFPSTERFLKFKKQFYNGNKQPQPTNADIRELYEEMIAQKKIKRKISFEQSMLSRGVRTQSGVAVVAVLTKSYACPGKCAFCPSEKNMPKSYLSNEPAVMRAIMHKFNPYQQVQARLQALMLNGHSTNKIELIVMGGTFSYFPKRYQTWFIKECFRACNEYQANEARPLERAKQAKGPAFSERSNLRSTLPSEQKRNEKTKTRIVGLTLETRPDWIDVNEIINFLRLGCTRVELGVQSIYDDVLKKNRRGHLTAATIQATTLLKNAGFKINYHMMPGLQGNSPRKDFQMFQELFNNSDYQPDMLKIYPTVVIKGTSLYRWWKDKKYKALGNRAFENLVIKIKNKAIPPYTRIQRLVRDVPLPSIEAGPTISNLRQIIAPKTHCQCIRCREIKGEYTASKVWPLEHNEVKREARPLASGQTNQNLIYGKQNPVINNIVLNRIDYDASGGKEIFLQFIAKDKFYNPDLKTTHPGRHKLYALLRLYIPCSNENNNTKKNDKATNTQNCPSLIKNLQEKLPILKNSAIIREVHTYGKLTAVGKRTKNSPQHIGLGKKLLLEAEKIAQEELTKINVPKDKQRIIVISGIGVRDYYRKNGYRLQNTYMVKKLY